MRVLALTKYGALGASSRMRTLQYLPYLRSLGWEIDVSPFLDDQYIVSMYGRRPLWRHVLMAYLRRLRALASVSGYDLIWIEKEALPWVVASVERFLLRKAKRVIVDYDDAMFHRYDQHRSKVVRAMLGRKIDAVMAVADAVIAGNDYLAERAHAAGAKRIDWIPTVIDVEKYRVAEKEPSKGAQVIGWIGSPETAGYLAPLFEAFNKLAASRKLRFIAVGAQQAQLEGSPFEAVPWAETEEVALISSFDIGIMPLRDTPWKRGKCGYKLIQYMACGLPVIASPVGVNRKLVNVGVNGFLADSATEWVQALVTLLDDEYLRRQMGEEGRRLVMGTYTLQQQAPRLADIFCDVASERPDA